MTLAPRNRHLPAMNLILIGPVNGPACPQPLNLHGSEACCVPDTTAIYCPREAAWHGHNQGSVSLTGFGDPGATRFGDTQSGILAYTAHK